MGRAVHAHLKNKYYNAVLLVRDEGSKRYSRRSSRGYSYLLPAFLTSPSIYSYRASQLSSSSFRYSSTEVIICFGRAMSQILLACHVCTLAEKCSFRLHEQTNATTSQMFLCTKYYTETSKSSKLVVPG